MRATTILSLFVFPTIVTTHPIKLTFKKRDARGDATLHVRFYCSCVPVYLVLTNDFHFLVQTTYGAHCQLAPSRAIASKPLPSLRLTWLLTEGTTGAASTLSPTARLAIIISTSVTGSLLLLALIIYIYIRWSPSPRTQVPVEDPLPNPPLSPRSIRIVGVSEVPEAVEDNQSMTNVRSPWSPINPGFPEIGLVDFSRSEVQPGTRVDASQTHLPIAERNESGFFSTSSLRSRSTDDVVRSPLS